MSPRLNPLLAPSHEEAAAEAAAHRADQDDETEMEDVEAVPAPRTTRELEAHRLALVKNT